MREHKYRAWDKKEKKFESYFQIDCNGVLSIFNPMKAEWEKAEKDRFELLQYTGLKDKNGTECFEGDIVCRVYPNDRKKKNEETIDEIRFIESEGAFCFYQKTSQGEGWSRMYGGHAMFWWKIIGNIYELKNLLTNQNLS